MKVTGKILGIYKEQIISEKFKKREFVLELDVDNPEYPQYRKMEFINDKCALLDSFNSGDEVEIEFNLRGRRWTDPQSGKNVYFNTDQAWRISRSNNAPPIPPEQYTVPPYTGQPPMDHQVPPSTVAGNNNYAYSTDNEPHF